jgi:hypothetical protein
MPGGTVAHAEMVAEPFTLMLQLGNDRPRWIDRRRFHAGVPPSSHGNRGQGAKCGSGREPTRFIRSAKQGVPFKTQHAAIGDLRGAYDRNRLAHGHRLMNPIGNGVCT